MSSSSTAPKEMNLNEYFWISTVRALDNGLPPPRLEFYCDGIKSFMLQAEIADGLRFVLVDYDDFAPFAASAEEKEGEDDLNIVSKRGLEFVQEDDDAVVGNEVFATEFAPEQTSVNVAIRRVVQWFTESQPQWNALDAIVTKAVLSYNDCNHETDRRYDDVARLGGETPHRLSRKSENIERLETAGDAALTLLRILTCYTRQKLLRIDSCAQSSAQE